MTKRNLLRILRTPQMLVIGAIQPALLLILFRYVLGGAINIPGVSYVDYVVPAIFLEAVLIGGMTTSISLAEDLKSGIIDRFRSLPMSRSAVLAGRTLADLCRSVLSLTIMIGLGVAVGFRFQGSVPRHPRRHGLARPRLRLRLFVALRGHRPRHQGSRDCPGGGHPALLRPRVRQQRHRAHQHDAGLAPAVRPQSADQRCHQLGTGPVRRWATLPDLWQAIVWCLGIFVVFFFVSLNLYRKIEA